MTNTLSQRVKISLGTSAFKNEIVQKQMTIENLFDKLSEPQIKSKKDGNYFIFGSFKQNVRNAQNVDMCYGATIDLDDTDKTVEQIKESFKKYTHCIYTTFNHKAEGKGDRYRLVLPYKTPVDAITHVETMLYIMHLIGIKSVDVSSKALSRPMYLPATTDARKKHFEFEENVTPLLFNPTQQKIRDKVAELAFEMGELNQDSHTQFDINQDVDEGGRNDALARAVGKFIKTGVAINEIFPLAYSWNTSKLSPPLSEKEVKTICQSIVKAHTRNHSDLDWGYDEILSRIKNSKDINESYEHTVDMIAVAKTKNKLKPAQSELLINALRDKSKIAKKTIQNDLRTRELSVQAQDEETDGASFEVATGNLKKDFQEWVYVASDDRMYNLKTGEYLKREAFGSTFANPNIDGSIVSTIMKYDLVKKVSRLEFDPSQPKIYKKGGLKYANTYMPPDIFPLPGDVDIMLTHFEYLIPSEYERNILLNFIAHLVQHPGTKIRWMPVIKGGKGIGKTIIAEMILLPLIGMTNFGKVNNEVLKSDFNAWQLDKQLVVFEELNTGGTIAEKIDLTNRLKSFITDNILTAHRKGLDPYDTINKANSIGFTNEEDALVITPDERRFCLMRTQVKPKAPEYYAKLARFAETHHSEMYYYFLERDITEFDASVAPTTDYTREVKGESLQWPASILTGWIEDPDHPLHVAEFSTLHHITRYIQVESTGRYKTFAEDLQNVGSSAHKKLGHSLRDLGFTRWNAPDRKDGRVYYKGSLHTVYRFPYPYTPGEDKIGGAIVKTRLMKLDSNHINDYQRDPRGKLIKREKPLKHAYKTPEQWEG